MNTTDKIKYVADWKELQGCKIRKISVFGLMGDQCLCLTLSHNKRAIIAINTEIDRVGDWGDVSTLALVPEKDIDLSRLLVSGWISEAEHRVKHQKLLQEKQEKERLKEYNQYLTLRDKFKMLEAVEKGPNKE